MVNFLKIFEKFFLHRPSGVLEPHKRVRPDGAAPFSAPAERGTRTAAGGFALTGRLFFLHRLTGAHELPQAGSPFPGGEFSAEPQRRVALCGAREVAAPAAGAKRKGHLRFPFLFELLPFPCFLIWRRFPICDRFENRERQSGYLSVCFATYSQFTDRLLLHIRATLRWVRHKVNCPKGKRGSPGG